MRPSLLLLGSLQEIEDRIARDGEPETLRVTDLERVDSDDLPALVDQRSSAVPGIDRGVMLDERDSPQVSSGGADDSARDGETQFICHRRPDGIDRLTDSELVPAAEGQRIQNPDPRLIALEHYDGEVVLFIQPLDGRREALPSVGEDADSLIAGDHMSVREDVGAGQTAGEDPGSHDAAPNPRKETG